RNGGRVPIAICVLVSVALAACGQSSRAATPSPTVSSSTITIAPPTTVARHRATAPPRRASGLVFRRAINAAAPLRIGYIGDSVASSIIPAMPTAALEFVGRTHLPMGLDGGGFVGPGFGLTADVAGHNDIGPVPPPSAFANWQGSVQKMVANDNPDV